MAERIAVVTGGSHGLGLEVARGLLAGGYKVAIFARSRASLDAAAADLGGDVLALSVDIGDDSAVTAGFAQVDERLGPVDTLVNAAGIYPIFGIEDATAERIMPVINTNFCGAVYCMREAIKRMRGTVGGDIINVGSESVRQSTPLLGIYTSTKAALEKMTTLMGEELREDGIRCVNFRVGHMNSHGTGGGGMSPEMGQRFVERSKITGAGYWSGPGMQPSSAAAVLVNLLLTPRDARVELIEIRSY